MRFALALTIVSWIGFIVIISGVKNMLRVEIKHRQEIDQQVLCMIVEAHDISYDVLPSGYCDD